MNSAPSMSVNISSFLPISEQIFYKTFDSSPTHMIHPIEKCLHL